MNRRGRKYDIYYESFGNRTYNLDQRQQWRQEKVGMNKIHYNIHLPDEVIEKLNNIESKAADNRALSLRSLDDKMFPRLCKWLYRIAPGIRDLDLSHNLLTSTAVNALAHSLKGRNNIKSINFSLNALDDTSIDGLITLLMSNSSISYLGLRGNKITDAGIERLAPVLVKHPEIKYVSLTQNVGITDKSVPLLCGVISNSKIEVLSVTGCSITDQSSLACLLLVNTARNGNSRVNFPKQGINDVALKELCDVISSYGIRNLKRMRLKNNQISSQGASILFESLKDNKSSLVELDLRANLLDNSSLRMLGDMLRKNKTIEEINIGANNISDAGIAEFIPLVFGNKTLKTLVLSSCRAITNASVPDLIKLYEESNISYINVHGTSIRRFGMLLMDITHNLKAGSLGMIKLSNVDVNGIQISLLPGLLRTFKCRNLSHIEIIGMGITSPQAIEFFESLKDHESVKDINFRGNSLNDECMDALGDLIYCNPSINRVDISHNSIGNNGLATLVNYLIGNTSLSHLNICKLAANSASTPLLLDLLAQSHIKKIILDGLMIPYNEISEIRRKMDVPIEERELPILSKTKSAAKVSKF